MTLLGYDILKAPLDTLELKNIKTINTINPHSYCTAKKDNEFMHALKESDVFHANFSSKDWLQKVHTEIERSSDEFIRHFKSKYNVG